VRAAIQASDEPGTVLAEGFGDEEDQKTVQWTVFPTNARRYLFVAIDRATRLGCSSASSRQRLSIGIQSGP
jgi:hypothetical protein